MSRKKDVAEVFNNWFDDRMFDIHSVLPGNIVSYEGSATRKATVQPLIKLRNRRNELLQINPIDNVPVIFPSSNNFNFIFPLNPGDGVLLLFSETGIGNFLNSGKISDADDINRFNLSDCIAMPGMWSFTNVPNTAVNKIELDQSGKITINGSLIDLLTGATESFLKGTTWQTNWTAFNAAVQAATPGDTAANAAAITAIKVAFAVFAGQLTNMLSTLIKGK